MIVTLDTNILLSALGWDGPEFKLMNLIFDKQIDLAVSPQILEESIGVAKSKKFNFSDDEIDEFIDAILTSGKVVLPEEHISIIKEDPSDDRILECAKISKSKYIITGDKHLLKLKNYEKIKIMRSSEFLRLFLNKSIK